MKKKKYSDAQIMGKLKQAESGVPDAANHTWSISALSVIAWQTYWLTGAASAP